MTHGKTNLKKREKRNGSDIFIQKKPARHASEGIILKYPISKRIKELGTPARACLRYLTGLTIAALALPLMNCGGGGGSSSTPVVPQNPSPSISALVPANAPAGSRPLTLTVNGSGFITGSVIQWSGAARATTYVSSLQLTTTLNPSDLSTAGTAAVSVFNPSPGGGTSTSLNFTISAVEPLAIKTARLPDAYHSKEYNYTLRASGGIAPYTWSLAGGGSLPGGLTLASGGGITGTPPTVADDTTYPITVQVSDYAYVANTKTRDLNLVARAAASPGRNDTCGTATPISNGVLRASISPFGDIDVYSFQGTADNKITAEIYAMRLTGVSVHLDSYLEILNSSCEVIKSNDDIDIGVVQDSLIPGFSLPSTGIYYIRVSDLRGDGRPDLIYDLHLSGANE